MEQSKSFYKTLMLIAFPIMLQNLPVCYKKNDIIFFNPGSTSIPKGGNKASFGIYENKTLSVLDLIDEKQMLTLSI